MEIKLTNRVTMLKTVSAYMAEHGAVWNAMAPLRAAMMQFNAKLTAIDAAAEQHETPTGATEDKADARETLEDATFLMCEALGVLAHDTDDNDLTALTEMTRSTLERMVEEELSNRASAVLAKANLHKTQLEPYQVTQENIDELTNALTEFNAAKAGPRNATANRAVLTESLPRLIKEASDILKNKVDRMVNLFSRTNPDFVAGYENARVIIDRAATHKTKAATAPPATNP